MSVRTLSAVLPFDLGLGCVFVLAMRVQRTGTLAHPLPFGKPLPLFCNSQFSLGISLLGIAFSSIEAYLLRAMARCQSKIFLPPVPELGYQILRGYAPGNIPRRYMQNA